MVDRAQSLCYTTHTLKQTESEMGYFDDTKFSNLEQMIEAVDTVVERNIRALATETKPENLGLDRRAGYRVLVTEDAVIVEASERGPLDYYGGFEYVDSNCVTVLGSYVIYSAQDERVKEGLDVYFQRDEQYADPDDFNSVSSPAHY
jgi:predicted homoserine dehydrogenase-like protein